MMRRFVVPSLAAGLVLSTVAVPAAGQEADGPFTLTVLHANDGESAMLPSAYEFTGDEDLVALACLDGAAPAGFTDVPAGNPHIPALDCGAATGVIRGTSATTYDPAGDLTRGQTASLLLRMLGEAGVDVPSAAGAPDFSDIGPPHGVAVQRLANAGIVFGREDGSYGTQDPIRRDALASLIIRSLEYTRDADVEPEGDNPFDDVNGGVHEANIVAAAELGLVQGKGDDRFAPRDQTRRDQAASLVVRLQGRIFGETEPAAGAARFVAEVKRLQEVGSAGDDAGVLTISSGDNFLAGPQYTASIDSFADGGPFYDALVFLEAGFDAMTIGNHEFDFGPQGLADFITASDPLPFLSANLDFSAEPSLQELVEDGRIAASETFEVEGREVGVIGATTEILASISTPGDVVIEQVLPAVEAEVAALQDDGVDIILLSSHLQNLDNEADLIADLSGVDAVIGGGGAEDLRDAYPLMVEDADGNDVPLVTTPGSYRDVGNLVLEFDGDGDLTGVGAESGLLAVPPFGPKDANTVENVEAPVGEAVAELANTVVATSEVPLDARTPFVRTRETNLGYLLAEGLMLAAGADVGLQNGGGVRSDQVLAAGEITALDTFNVAPFGNFLAIDTVTGDELIDLLEHGLSGLPGVEGRFGQWAGVQFSYDDSQPAGERLVDAVVTRDNGDIVPLVVAGEAVPASAAADFTIAGLNFTLNGGDGYPFDGDFTTLGQTDQQVLLARLDDLGTVSAADYPDLTVDNDDYANFGPSDEFTVVVP